MKFPAIVLGALAVSVLPGCLINTHNSTTVSGRDVSPSTMAQIEPGVTKEEFVMATLGPPTTRTVLEDGSEVWKYEYRKKTQSSGRVFLLFNGDNYSEKDGAVFVILKDGVVQKTWRG